MVSHALPFIDAHAHLWDLNRLPYPWLSPPFENKGPDGDTRAIAVDHLLSDHILEAKRWNLVGMVHVEAGADFAMALEETDWLQGLADQHGMPNGIVAAARLNHPNLDALLAAHAARRNVRGVRHIVNWHADPNRTYSPRDVTQDEDWQRGFALLKQHGLSFDLQAYPGQFPALAALIAKHPETPVIINHAGMGIDTVEEWRAGMKALAALPNVFVKISGLGWAHHALKQPFVRDRVRETIDIFGAARAMFASNFPTDRLIDSYDATMSALTDAVADFSEAERRALFARNANRIYRLGLDV